jgi:hypothetical protein
MAAFDLALTCIRDGADDFLLPERINQLALAQGHSFRNTTLTPSNTLRLFVQQVAHGNVACSAVRHLAGEDFSDSAWCQARSRLPMELIRQVHQDIVDQGRRQLSSADDVGDASYRWRRTRRNCAITTECRPPAPRTWVFPRRICCCSWTTAADC